MAMPSGFGLDYVSHAFRATVPQHFSFLSFSLLMQLTATIHLQIKLDHPHNSWAMDLIHNFLNIIAPPFTFFSLCLFLPPFLLFKFFLSILRSILSENVAGKVVLITGASSGIGEHLAYEYAKRRACLALAARRENQLQEVVDKAREYGSPDVIAIQADVARVEDCKRLVNEADMNFWGSVYTTHFSVSHLRNSKGKIIVLSSSASWLPVPRTSFYNASNAALVSLYETLRVEFGPDIGITIVTPGFIKSEMTQAKYLQREGKMEVQQELRDVQLSTIPAGRVGRSAKTIVSSVCRGERYVTEPAWFKITYFWKVFCPEVIEWSYRLLFVTRASPIEDISKKILDLTGAKKIVYPSSIQSSELKAD